MLTIDTIREKGTIVYEVYRGSYAYGTYIEGVSDKDKAGVFILPLDMMLSGEYYEQVSDAKNDEVYYEIGRFLELLASNNPSMLELLNVSPDKVIYKHPIMDVILSKRDKFITKKCKNSFGGYVKQQLEKASGLNKMMNWEKSKVERKTLLEFIYTPFEQGSQHIQTWLDKRGLKQEYCGLVSIPNMRYTYNLFYDYAQHLQREKVLYDDWNKLGYRFNEVVPASYDSNFIKIEITEEVYNDFIKEEKNFKYKGILQKEDLSNEVSLSSVPKGESPLCVVQVNHDGYQQHCKIYKQYQTWLKERNTNRYISTVNANGGKTDDMIDSKNLLHAVRLLRMSREIAEGKGIIVKRPDFEYLLEIRNGKHNLPALMTECVETLKENDKLYDASNLPDDVDISFIRDLLKEVRKEFYQL